MPDYPARYDRPGWWARATDAVATYTRATLAQMGLSPTPPTRAGASRGTFGARPRADEHLRQMALSPTVFAAAMRRARTFGDYPFVVLVDGVPVEPREVPWAKAMLELLQNPDPEYLTTRGDVTGIAALVPGEGLIAQLVVDILLEGVAWILPTAGRGQSVAGLTRLHPRCVKLVMGGAYVEHTQDGRATRYPRRSVFCITNPSWQATGEGQLGVGAGEVLEPIVAAERVAMEKTASIIAQGGADVVVTGSDNAGKMLLSNETNRTKITKEVSDALAMTTGSRVIALGGPIELNPLGLTPSDIQAPTLMEAAHKAELMAMGVVPVAIGENSANFATAALQYRVQAELDEAVASMLEAYWLRPLAQHYARAFGGLRVSESGRVTCRLDLSDHPGYVSARGEAITRMGALVDLGWSPVQAAAFERLPLPKPEGQPRRSAPPNPALVPQGDTPAPQGDAPKRGAPLLLLGTREPASLEEDSPAARVGAGR